MVRRPDHHSVDLLVHFFEHPTEVLVSLSPAESLECLRRVHMIDIAQRDNILAILARNAVYIRSPAPTDTYPCYIQPAVGLGPADQPAVGDDNQPRSQTSRPPQKLTTI